ncbi:MAG TPA: TatD family hydrolase [Anaerolineales bacterium]|nr:TatD family hydrolase [Anaerolineales bacterium]
MLTDTHCHLNLHPFDEDREEVVERAREAGLVRLLIPAVDRATSRSAMGLAAAYAEIYAAVGVHPNSIGDWGINSRNWLAELAVGSKVVAIGEIGLDYYWDKYPKERQQDVFTEQLNLAAELALPVVIHNREATDDVLAILEDWVEGLAEAGHPLAARPGVLHSFSGDTTQAETAITAGFLLGITGPVTFKNARDLQALVAALSLDRLLIETDAPYLTPHPHRGTRNEPAHVCLVAGKIAELKGIPVDEVLHATYENSVRLFQW